MCLEHQSSCDQCDAEAEEAARDVYSVSSILRFGSGACNWGGGGRVETCRFSCASGYGTATRSSGSCIRSILEEDVRRVGCCWVR